MERVNKKLDELVSYVKDTNEYRKCLSLKAKMKDNEEIVKLVERIKELQKKYVQTGKDIYKEKLDEANAKLLDIPIYVTYLRYLEDVNYMIDFIKDSLNDYFDKLLK